MSYLFAIGRDGAPVLLDAAAVEEKPAPDPAKVEEAHRALVGSVNRRRDSVVDAARTLEDLSPEGVEQFVRRRWRGDRAVSPEDFQSFSADARTQRVHDVVDALDFRIRRAIYGRGGTKHVHVSIPRGIVSRSLALLGEEELADALARLKDRGWSENDIKRDRFARNLMKEKQ